MEKCTVEYNIRFNKWRIDISSDDSGIDMEAFMARNEMLRQKETLLFKGTDIVEDD